MRGWLVLVALPLLIAIYFLATQVHYTERGYCIGSITECYLPEGEGKR